MVKQCAYLETKAPGISFMSRKTGRKITLKAGDKLWVTATAKTHPSVVASGFVLIARRNNGHVGMGWCFHESTLPQFFEVEE